MAATAFSHLIDKSPTYLPEYFEAKLPEKSVMISSGLAQGIPQAESALKSNGGKTVAMNFYDEFTTAEEVLAADTDLTVRNMTTDSDIGVVCARGLAVGAEDLARVLAATDPLAEFAKQRTNYWARAIDTALIKVAAGALGALGATVQLDKSANDFNFNFIIEGVDLMGDNSDELSIILMHSKVFHKCLLLGLVSYPDATAIGAGPSIMNGGFIGNRRVYVSDQLPVSSNVYSTYVAASGAFSILFQKDIRVELERLPRKAGGTDVIVNTVHFVPHKNYVKYTGTASGITPTNAELATTGNWSGVADNDKNYRVVEIKSLASLT